jgi:GTP-binding protein
MAFLDEITIEAKAGNGGNGVVRWRREKFIAKGGPNGGNGGRGGHVYIRAVRSFRVLDQYRSKKEFFAPNGVDGGNRSYTGADGDRLTIDFPVGSVVTNVTTGAKYDLNKEGIEFKLLSGGAGGHGNEYFKSSTNQAPDRATDGKPGEEAVLHVVISLIADVGLIGFPNAGKSSLLNIITNAQAKVGDYPFTTLDPNLGDLYGYIIADIPGLIEGAHEGKGLGHKFLRHISKTKIVVHLVSFEQPDMMDAYKVIRTELEKFKDTLEQKEEIILLTKTDTVTPEVVADTIKKFKKLPASPTGGKKPVFAVSLFDDSSVKEFSDELIKFLKKE